MPRLRKDKDPYRRQRTFATVPIPLESPIVHLCIVNPWLCVYILQYVMTCNITSLSRSATLNTCADKTDQLFTKLINLTDRNKN